MRRSSPLFAQRWPRGGGLAALTGGRSLISGDVALLVNKAFESVEMERKAVHGGAGVKATRTI